MLSRAIYFDPVFHYVFTLEYREKALKPCKSRQWSRLNTSLMKQSEKQENYKAPRIREGEEEPGRRRRQIRGQEMAPLKGEEVAKKEAQHWILISSVRRSCRLTLPAI